MPLAYRQVKDLYDTLHAVGVTGEKSLPDWATEMNSLTSSDLYSAGLHDNFIKRASVGLDRLIEKTTLPDIGRQAGRYVGEALGDPEAGARVGEGIPRGTLNFAPMLIPGVGWGATAARLGLTGLLSGAETYTSTGSPAAGAISGLVAAALPGATGRIEQLAARSLGAPLVEGAISDLEGNVINRISTAIPETFAQKAGTFTAGQVGAAGIMEGSKAAQNYVTGQDQVNPFSVENLLNLTLGQVPFAAIHGARSALGKKDPTAGELQHAIDTSTPLIEAKRAADKAARETPIESLPNVVPDETVSAQVIKETQTRLAEIRGEQVDTKTKVEAGLLTPEQGLDEQNRLLREETNVMRQREGVVPSARTVFGDSIVEDSPRQQVVGRELRSTDKWRAILVDDIPVNPPELRGKIVSYSTAYEPNPTRRSTGDSVYGLPPSQWQTVKTQEEWHGKPKNPSQPDLPVSPEETSRAQMFAHLEDLKKVEISADAAKTPLDLQQAVVKLQDVEHQNGLQPTSDAELRREAATLEKDGKTNPQDIPKVAVKVRAKKVSRRIQEQSVPPLSPEEAAKVSAEMGAGGFSVITADKLSHNEPSTTPFGDLVTEKAYGITHGELATKPEDVNMFRTLIEHLGTLPEKGMTNEINDVANFIAERDGVTVAEAKDEVNHFITVPHVQEWGKTLDAQVAKLRETNAAPVGPLFHATNANKIVGDRYEPITLGDLKPTPDNPLFASFDATGAGYLRGKQGQIFKFHVEGKLAADDDISRVAQKIGVSDDALIQQDDDTFKLISALHKEGFDGAQHFDQNHETGDVIPAVVVWNKEAIIKERSDAPSWTSIEPESERDVSLMSKVGTDGASGLKFLTDFGEVPAFKALAKDLSKFTDSLGRIDLSVGKTDTGTSFARDMGNGRVQAVISDAAMNNRSVFEFHVLHEIAHGLSLVELNNPTKVGLRTEIEGIRQKLADSLPTKLKDQLGFLERTQWRDQYAKGQVSFASILPEGTDAQRLILYALTSTNEFVAQGLSSRAVMDYMKGIKYNDERTFFSRFVATIKQLLGVGENIKSTVFEEFLSKTDQLLDRGNYVSSFRDFSDRYFENLGMSEGEVGVNTRRALGVLLNNRFDTTARDILYQLSDTNLIRSSDVGVAQRDMTAMFQQKEAHPHYEETSKVLDELGLESSPQGLNDFTHSALIDELPNHEDAIDLLPATAQRFVFAKLQDMQNVFGVLKAAGSEKNKGLINIADPKQLAGPVLKASKMLDRMLSIKNEWEQSEQNVQRMGAIAPDAFLDHAVSAPFEPEHAPVLEAFGNESLKKQKRGIGWFLNPVAQLARGNPLTAELINRGFQLEPAAKQYFGNITKVLGIDLTGNHAELNSETSKAAIKTIQNPRTQKAIDRWMAENQLRAKAEERGVTLLNENDPKIQGFLKGLSDKERQGVIDTVSRAGAMTVLGQNSALNYMGKIASTSGALIVMKDTGGTSSQSMDVATKMFDSVVADRTNPQAAQEADAKLRLIQSKTTEKGFLDLLRFAQNEGAKWKVWQEYFQQNPGWATAQRQEKFLVSFTRGGKKYQLQASSAKEAKVIAEGGSNLEITDNWKGRNDEFPVLGPDAPALMTRLQELDANAKQIMTQAGLTPEQLDAYDKASPATQLAREAAATGGGIPEFKTPPRLLSQGAEELPFLWNHISWAQRQSNYWTRQLFRAQAELHLSDPELSTRPDLQKLLRTHVDNILQPDPAIIQKVNHFTSTWFMGFAPASAMVNGMQTLSTLVPELTNVNGGRVLNSYGTWKSAVADVIAHTSTGRGKVWKDPEIDSLMRKAEQAGQVGFSMWDENAQVHEQIATNWKRALMKNKPQNVGQRLTTLSGAWSTAAMWMFKNVEMFNQRVALVAGYKTYREMGQEHDEAVQSSFGLNQAVNYGGGRAGRPVGLYSGRDIFSRGAAMLASNMQNYNLGVVGQLSRYLQSGYFRPEGVTPAEVYSSRKAATQMLGTQLAAAGLLGLPFVSGMLAVLNQFFPSLEINKKLREGVADFFGSDKENGNVLGDAAMTGLPSMLGWDMQSRLSMGNITPGVSEYNGFQPGLLLGPPANLVGTFVNGLAQVVQGQPQGAQAFIPPGLKKLTQYISNDNQLKDYRERPIFKPTTGETVGLALGFNPKRLSDFNSASKIVDQSQTVANRRSGQEHQALAEEALKGNFGTVRQTLLAKAQSDNTYNPREGVRAIARAAEELTFPRDLRREGTLSTSAARGKLLDALNITPSASASEVDRLKFRQGIEQHLGVVPSSNQELATAMLVDQLRSRYPDESRVQLRNRAAQMLHVSARTSLLPPE